MEKREVTEIVVQRDGREATLLFTCPNCKNHLLIETNTAVEVDLSLEYVAIETGENGEPSAKDMDYGSDYDAVGPQAFSEVFYRCAGCNSQLSWTNKDGESRPVQDGRKLAKWMLKNCSPQAQ